MPTVNIHRMLLEPGRESALCCPRGDTFEILLSIETESGSSEDLTGKGLRLDYVGTGGSDVSMPLIPGNQSGPYHWHFHGSLTATWGDLFRFEIWLVDPMNLEDDVILVEPSEVQITETIHYPLFEGVDARVHSPQYSIQYG